MHYTAERRPGRAPPRRGGTRPWLDLAAAAAVLVTMAIVVQPGLAIPAVLAAVLLLGIVSAKAVAAAAHAVLGRDRRRAAGPRTSASVHVGRVAIIASAAILVPAGISYVEAMMHRSDSSLGIRSVEWLRDNGGAWLVSDVENLYYTITAPAKGGAGLRALPAVGVAVQPPPQVAHRKPPYAPPRIRPVVRGKLRGEGVWRPTRRRFAGAASPPMLVTSYRPDPSYPRVVAGLAWIDPRRTTMALYPGLQEPPGGSSRSGEVPARSRGRLLATFNSGFKHADGNGGFFAGGRLWEPLVPGDGTIVATRNGRVDIRAWRGGPRPGPNVVFARQNLPLIVDHGRLNPNLSDGPEWGATLGNAVLVWRSGIGVDRRGDLIYAAANDMTVSSLARVLQHAGAVRAIELDINSYWISLITYGKTAARDPHNLLPGMIRPPSRYLTADDRDFFAVYVR